MLPPISRSLDPQRLEAVGRLLDRYVNQGKIPGYSCLVSRFGEEAGFYSNGLMDVERAREIKRDTIFRIYSMTKPLTSVAVMQLYQQGHLLLEDEIGQYLPEWNKVTVYQSGGVEAPETVATDRPITIRHLLTHTAGLTYGFHHSHIVDELYRIHGIDVANGLGDASQRLERLTSIPLLFQPGTRWNYSVATDVLGYLVEVISGQSLDQYIAQHICDPLGMVDSGFVVRPDQRNRFSACFQTDQQGGFSLQDDPETSAWLRQPEFISGGGGMVSTIDDYHQFCLALLGRGCYRGTRILGTRTTEYMTLNHLPGNADLHAMSQSAFSETAYDGIGFGLGFSVVIDPAAAGVLCSPGEFSWGGMAGTAFWVDPVEQIIVILMTQLMPSSIYPIRRQLRSAVYQALE